MVTREEKKTQGPRLALNLKFTDSDRTAYIAWHNSNHDALTVQALTSKGISVFPSALVLQVLISSSLF